MQHAWEYYKLYAWGKNELRPISKRPHTGSIFGTSDLGATIIDGLDTLYLMNLTKEFNEGKDWIARRFTLENVVSKKVHRIVVSNQKKKIFFCCSLRIYLSSRQIFDTLVDYYPVMHSLAIRCSKKKLSMLPINYFQHFKRQQAFRML